MSSQFQFKRAKAIAKKEIFHVSRDPFTLAMAIGLPVIMVSIFGIAIDFNVKDIQVSVFDADRTQSSRLLLDSFQSSKHFEMKPKERPLNAVSDLDAERAKAILVIEPGFERIIGAGQLARAQVILDGSDNSTVGTILSYLNGVREAATRKITGEPVTGPLELQTRYLFNPELKSSWFIVPGIAVVVTAILGVLLTTLTIAREWENGSMELLLSTPVQPLEIIVGKLAPYTFLGLSAIAFVYVIARVGFGVPFVGSHLVLAGASTLFLAACLSQGLLISVIMRRQQLAMQIGIITGLLPSILLSGFIFPVESMPPFFQGMVSILPSKWFMIISRGVFLKGAGVNELLQPLAALLIMNVVLVFAAARRFKKDLEP